MMTEGIIAYLADESASHPQPPRCDGDMGDHSAGCGYVGGYLVQMFALLCCLHLYEDFAKAYKFHYANLPITLADYGVGVDVAGSVNTVIGTSKVG